MFGPWHLQVEVDALPWHKGMRPTELVRTGCVCKQWKDQVNVLIQLPQWVTAYSNATNFEDAIKDVFRRCSAPAFRPNVGFLFVADTYQSLKEDVIDKELTKLPPLHLGGCTGSGIIGYDQDQGKPVEAEPCVQDGAEAPVVAVSLALAHIPNAQIDSFCIADDEDLEEMLTAVSKTIDNKPRSVNFVVLADAKTRAAHARMGKLVHMLDTRFPQSEVTGGVASGFHRSGTTRVLWGERDGSSGARMGKLASKTEAAREKGVVMMRAACTVLSIVTADDAVTTEDAGPPPPLTYASVARSYSAVGPTFTIADTDGPVVLSVCLQGEDGQPKGLPTPAAETLWPLVQQLGLIGHSEMLCGVANVAKPNSSQLRMHGGEFVAQGIKLDLDRDEDEPASGYTLQLMSDGNPADMELGVHEQMRWTQELMSSKPGFGNRVVDGGRAVSKSMVRGGLLFSCCGRGARCYGRPNVDSEAFQAAFPASNGLCGFFCDGEIGPTHLGATQTQLHGFTSVFTLFEGV